jgi:hypothetical protein
MCRLHAFGVQVDFAADDGGGRQAAGFVKTRMPQPFIQSLSVAFFVRRHAAASYPKGRAAL